MRDLFGDRPLHLAAVLHDSAAVTKLLLLGADATIANNEGESLL